MVRKYNTIGFSLFLLQFENKSQIINTSNILLIRMLNLDALNCFC